jgi:hypothetical protein
VNGFDQPLPRPTTIPQVLTLKTLADVRELLKHIPIEKRELARWQHLEAALKAGDPAETAVVLKLVLQIERVPYSVDEK